MSANILKIIALITMTIDHVGMLIFPNQEWMRMIGRIAFPIYAFMISEGCRHTHSRRRYLMKIGLMGIGMQVVLFAATGSLYQSVFISFTLAIILIYVMDKAKNERHIGDGICAGVLVLIIAFLCLGLPEVLYKTDYAIDYSIVGVLIPVGCYFAKNRTVRMFVLALGLIALSLFYGDVQWWCLLAIPLLGMYNYQKGRLQLKNLFYFYYPVHLCVIFMIGMIMNEA